ALARLPRWRGVELEAILRRSCVALQHVALRSRPAFCGEPTPTHGFSGSARRAPPPLQFCGGRVRGDAGACASAGRRAGKGNTVDSDASPETALCGFCVAGAQATLAFTSAALGAGGSTHLAGSFL